MKKLTKLLSLALAILMVMSLAGAAFATDPPASNTTKIKISPTSAGAQYEYYKLMDVAVGSNNSFSYMINTTYKPAIMSALSITGDASAVDDQVICDKMRELTTDTAKKEFANKLYAALSEGSSYTPTGRVTVAEGSTSVEINGTFGYYLIAQTVAGSGDNTSTSAILLDTAYQAEVPLSPKLGKTPLSEKRVYEFNDTTDQKTSEQDGADYDIGDMVEFVIKGDVVDDISEYSNIVEEGGAKVEKGQYNMIFHDKPENTPSGLTFDKGNAELVVKINHLGSSCSTEFVTVPASKYTVKTPADGVNDGCAFHVEMDLLHLKDNIDDETLTPHAGDKIRVEFKMRLNENAKSGSAGNPNVSWIQYSNKPFTESLGKTTEDKVIVFTYDLVVNKVDGEKQPLEGAKFKLYKHTPTGDIVVGQSATSDGEKSGDSSYETVDGEQKLKKVTFTWHGLDAGMYRLEETSAPEGYTKAPDVYFEVVTTYDTNKPDPKFTKLTINKLTPAWTSDPKKPPFDGLSSDPSKPNELADSSQPITITIENKSGTLLPATGGIGTTLFYVFGSILAIGAGVLLVSKKRMGAAD